MAFEERIRVLIQSVFDSHGFDELNFKMAQLMERRDALQKQFNRGIGMKNIGIEIDQITDKFKEAGLELDTFGNSILEMEDKLNKEGKSRKAAAGNFLGGTNLETTEDLKDQLAEFGGVFRDIETGEIVELGNQTGRLADATDRLDKGIPFNTRSFGQLGSLADAMESFQARDLDMSRLQPVTGDPFGGEAGAGLATGREMGVEGNRISGMNFGQILQNAEIASIGTQAKRGANGFVRFSESMDTTKSKARRLTSRGISGLKSAMSGAAGSTRALQMRLLGLQFTMLTVAFIFGGLLASALGAVGAFQILGNTLKFLFLPTALDLLDPLLSLQERVFNLDEETRNFIGRLFAVISVVSIAIGIFAALAQPIVGLISGLLKLSGVLRGAGILGFFGTLKNILAGSLGGSGFFSGLLSVLGASPGGALAAFKSALPAITTAGVASTIGSIIGAIKTAVLVFTRASAIITVVVAAVLGLLQAFSRFPIFGKIVNATIDAVIGAFEFFVAFLGNLLDLFMQFFNGIKNIFSGLFTAIFGIFTLNGDKVIQGFQEMLFGIGKAFEAAFGDIFRFLSNNVIGGIVEFGRNLVFALIDTIVDKASALKDAILAVLPDFAAKKLDLNIEAIGKKAKDFIDQGIQDVSEFTGQFSGFTLGKDFARSSASNQAETESSSGQTVNNVSVQADLRKGQDTPREKGRKLGEGVADGLVNKGSNFATGT